MQVKQSPGIFTFPITHNMLLYSHSILGDKFRPWMWPSPGAYPPLQESETETLQLAWWRPTFRAETCRQANERV